MNMNRKTDYTERLTLPYESPEVALVEVMTEGVLCESAEREQELELPDYNPSSGAW